jgi:hypothetical protein
MYPPRWEHRNKIEDAVIEAGAESNNYLILNGTKTQKTGGKPRSLDFAIAYHTVAGRSIRAYTPLTRKLAQTKRRTFGVIRSSTKMLATDRTGSQNRGVL